MSAGAQTSRLRGRLRTVLLDFGRHRGEEGNLNSSCVCERGTEWVRESLTADAGLDESDSPPTPYHQAADSPFSYVLAELCNSVADQVQAETILPSGRVVRDMHDGEERGMSGLVLAHPQQTRPGLTLLDAVANSFAEPGSRRENLACTRVRRTEESRQRARTSTGRT